MPTNQLCCEIIDLDNETQLHHLGKCFGGNIHENSLSFDNTSLKGDIISIAADTGLVIRKWKCTPLREISIRKLSSSHGEPKKFILLYFLNPGIVRMMNQKKKVRMSGSRNNLFLADSFPIELDFLPKIPVHIFEISFTYSWLMEQLQDADSLIMNALNEYIDNCSRSYLMEPFTLEEYKILHELELCMIARQGHDFFIRSRVYNLVINFFSKVVNRKELSVIQTGNHYDQLIEAESLIMKDIRKAPSIDTIARKVNMSVASLARKFKMIHGKNIYEYYVSKKMELARKMIVEHRLPVKLTAEILGYNQASAFIETFTKIHGYTPGTLKTVSRQFSFF